MERLTRAERGVGGDAIPLLNQPRAVPEPIPDVTWTHPGIVQILDSIPIATRSLLDVGCGRGIVGALCRIYRAPERLVGIDGYAPYLDFCRRRGFYDELVERELEALPLPFRDREFEVATCIEVIEHLARTDGLKLLDELERVAQTVIVTTPTSFFQQDEFDQNPRQQHRSVWHSRDFRHRGYVVHGAGGMKIMGRHVKLVSSALAPAVRYLPSLAEFMLCRKV
jgi:ubiquinone/menaquinone biosynthesis C-methylase UbiE